MSLPVDLYFTDRGPKPGRTYDPDVIRFVEQTARRLLPGWTIELLDEPPEGEEDVENYWAICDYGDNMTTLRLYLTDDILAASEDELHRTLVHEMLHPHFRELRFAFGYRDDDRPDETWVHFEELAVERLTGLLCPGSPIVRFG